MDWLDRSPGLPKPLTSAHAMSCTPNTKPPLQALQSFPLGLRLLVLCGVGDPIEGIPIDSLLDSPNAYTLTHLPYYSLFIEGHTYTQFWSTARVLALRHYVFQPAVRSLPPTCSPSLRLSLSQARAQLSCLFPHTWPSLAWRTVCGYGLMTACWGQGLEVA